MGDAVIFTPEVAEELIARGFELVAKTRQAWYFEDSVLFWVAVDEILEYLAHKSL